MKKVIGIVLTALLLQPTNAFAEANGAWVKVDANGNAVGGAIVCAQSVCGDSNSLYSRMTLGSNERYVLQAPALADGNVAGVGAGSGAKSVQVDLETKVWTVVQESKITEPVITILPNGKEEITYKVIGIQTATQRFTAEYAPWVSPVIQYPTIITQTPIVAPVNTAQQLSSAEVLKIKKKIARLNKKLK
jgi:hypothetical protein